MACSQYLGSHWGFRGVRQAGPGLRNTRAAHSLTPTPHFLHPLREIAKPDGLNTWPKGPNGPPPDQSRGVDPHLILIPSSLTVVHKCQIKGRACLQLSRRPTWKPPVDTSPHHTFLNLTTTSQPLLCLYCHPSESSPVLQNDPVGAQKGTAGEPPERPHE